LVIQIKTGKNKISLTVFERHFWLLPMMKPEMHRGGLALIFLCCVGFWEGGGKGGGLLVIFFFFLSSSSSFFQVRKHFSFIIFCTNSIFLSLDSFFIH